jgi:hypothetical protein
MLNRKYKSLFSPSPTLLNKSYLVKYGVFWIAFCIFRVINYLLTMEKQLKKALKDRKITIKQAAKHLGCDYKTLSNYLNGRSNINSGLLTQLLDLLNIKLCFVVF